MKRKIALAVLLCMCIFGSLSVRGDDSARISEYGRRVAEEFLWHHFPTVFMRRTYDPWGSHGMYVIPRIHGSVTADGRIHFGEFDDDWNPITVSTRRFRTGWYRGNPILTTEVPEVFLKEFHGSVENAYQRHGFYNRQGNRIHNALWAHNGNYATHFRLWKFDDSGIPVITVYFGGHWIDHVGHFGDPGLMFMYYNGFFQNVDPSTETNWDFMVRSYIRYYVDNHNNLFTVSSTGGWVYGYTRFSFIKNEVQVDSMLVFYEMGYWVDRINNQEHAPFNTAWWDGTTHYHLYRTLGLTLTPIAPLTQLRNDITALLTSRIYVYGIPLLAPHFPPMLSTYGFPWSLTAADMNLRTGPGTQYGVVMQILRDSWLEVLDSTRGDWHRIRGTLVSYPYSVLVGYMYAPLLRPQFQPMATQWPEPPPLPTPAPTPAPIVTPGAAYAAQWFVLPVTEIRRIRFCSVAFYHCLDSKNFVCINTAALLSVGNFAPGFRQFHAYVYDPVLGLAGYMMEYSGGTFLTLLPSAEFPTLFRPGTHALRAVQLVDSTQREAATLWGEPVERLADEAFSGRFAIMYNGRLVTDFIFDAGCERNYFNDNAFIPMGKGNYWGMVDRYGEIVIPFIFEHILIIDSYDHSHDGFPAFARINGLYGILDIERTIALHTSEEDMPETQNETVTAMTETAPASTPNPTSNPTTASPRDVPWQIISISAAGIVIAVLITMVVLKRNPKKASPGAVPTSGGFCGSCGNPRKTEGNFCNKCGAAL